jgi:thioredoxin 1
VAQEFTDANFESEVLSSDQPVLVDFSATWCGPCKMLNPIINELAQEYEGRVKVGKVDTDQSQTTAARYAITSVPTVLLFKGGEQVDRLIGVNSKSVYKQKIDDLL